MREISTQELRQKLQEVKEVSMIDVREEEEVEQGKIPGAVHIPLGELPYRMNEIDKDKQHVLICRSGGRSGKACQFLSQQGYDVINLVGGMLDWEGKVEI